MIEDKLISMKEFKKDGPPANPELDKLFRAVAHMASMRGAMKLVHEEQAINAKAKYDALIKAGFDKKQAIELCKEVK
jgi:hypothetical protein